MTTPGGPATVNGVLYQMLWSLLRALKMHVRECDRSADNAVERGLGARAARRRRGRSGAVGSAAGRRAARGQGGRAADKKLEQPGPDVCLQSVTGKEGQAEER